MASNGWNLIHFGTGQHHVDRVSLMVPLRNRIM